MSKILACLAVFGVLAMVAAMPMPVAAMGTDNEPDTSWRDDLRDAERHVKKQDYRRAIRLLSGVLKDQPKNADALNYMGYSHRKLGDYDKAVDYYRMALKVDPDHRGANEYLGEAFLELNDLPQAEERLAHLRQICGEDCDAYRELNRAVQAYKAGKAPKASNRTWK